MKIIKDYIVNSRLFAPSSSKCQRTWNSEKERIFEYILKVPISMIKISKIILKI